MENQKQQTKNYRYSPLTRYTRNLLKKVNRGIDAFNLISENDRVCVAVSGGKDSLSLLHLLLEHIRFYTLNYTVSAVHVVSDFEPQALETKAYLTGIFESLNIPYGFIDISVTTGKDGNKTDPSCFWCAWKRRQALFRYCVDQGYNKLALAHHSDDIAETTLLNLVYHGNLDTMLPKRTFFDGKFDLIRPLFYVRERELARFTDMAGFKTTSCVCPNADDSKRTFMKKMIRELYGESRQLHANLWRAARQWWEAFGEHPLHPNPRDNEAANNE
ncbi:MAG: tRNA 2-thiocytidine biosynthesis protein TtcA [Alphaproteobacteria bacterium]|nr:tRNA 2-thiocytidine biosynthesis protein TtcA [Alphaproteobacteria bacterium]